MGTVVIGKIESGKVRKGQSVLIMPNRVYILDLRTKYWCLTTKQKLAEVMAIMQEDEEVNMAKCGDNIRIRLKNAEEEV